MFTPYINGWIELLHKNGKKIVALFHVFPVASRRSPAVFFLSFRPTIHQSKKAFVLVLASERRQVLLLDLFPRLTSVSQLLSLHEFPPNPPPMPPQMMIAHGAKHVQHDASQS